MCYVFVETYNTLMKVVVVSSEHEMSTTDLALGLIRDMIAAGLGENFGALPSDVYCYESSSAPIYFYTRVLLYQLCFTTKLDHKQEYVLLKLWLINLLGFSLWPTVPLIFFWGSKGNSRWYFNYQLVLIFQSVAEDWHKAGLPLNNWSI